MNRWIIRCIALMICFSAVLQAGPLPLFRPLNVGLASLGVQDELVGDAVVLSLDEVQMASLLAAPPAFLDLQLPVDGTLREMRLKHFTVLAPHARTVAGTESGDAPFDMTGAFAAFRGQIGGIEGSTVVLTTSSLGVYAMIDDGLFTFNLVPLPTEAQPQAHLLYRADRLKRRNDFFCESELLPLPAHIRQLMAGIAPQLENLHSSDLLEVEMAIESDFETFNRYGSVQNATSYLLSLVATVSAVYIRDLNVKIVVPYTRVWSTVNDPYSATTSGGLLDQFRNYWNANMRSTPRDLAHYISTRPGGLGGVAWVDVLCSNFSGGYGYAFSDIDGAHSPLPVYSWDVDVVSHESGHNFGSPHTHNCGWQPRIDTCVVTDENNSCANDPRPIEGSIMSYCHLTSAGKRLAFHPQPIALMRARAEVAGCVSVANEEMLLVAPNGGESFIIDSEAQIIWGTSAPTTVDLYFSADNGASWSEIALGVPAVDRQYQWRIPAIPSTSEALVRIVDSNDPTRDDICDAPFEINARLFNYGLVSPAHLSTIAVAAGGMQPVDFIWESAGSLPGISYKSELKFGNNVFLADAVGGDTTVTLTDGRIDSLLTSWNAWGSADSVRVRWVAWSFFEGDSLRSSDLRFLWMKRTLTAIAGSGGDVPATFALSQNYPNPFNPLTAIRFQLPEAARVQLEIYDISGQRILAAHRNSPLPAGAHTFTWNSRNDAGQEVRSGIYFYRLTVAGTSSFTDVKKMMLIR